MSPPVERCVSLGVGDERAAVAAVERARRWPVGEVDNPAFIHPFHHQPLPVDRSQRRVALEQAVSTADPMAGVEVVTDVAVNAANA